MEHIDRQQHWERIYNTKALTEVSWYQPVPETSLAFIQQQQIPLQARIIDIGGGDSFLADHLLELGYQDITVLDISETAINRAKERLGDKAEKITWIVSDITQFVPAAPYDFWHDRAAFHFLTEGREVNRYKEVLQQGLQPHGIGLIGTFSEQGPQKCSGIAIKQYTTQSLKEVLEPFFEPVTCFTVDHLTPFDTVQNFIFCGFKPRLAT